MNTNDDPMRDVSDEEVARMLESCEGGVGNRNTSCAKWKRRGGVVATSAVGFRCRKARLCQAAIARIAPTSAPARPRAYRPEDVAGATFALR